MKAIVFAAGVGSRLKPFTDQHPKAMVEIGGKPILRHVLEKLGTYHPAIIEINVHHFADQIASYIHFEGSGSHCTLGLSDETNQLLDTAGALAKIARESILFNVIDPEGPIVVHNVDILTDFDLNEMLEQHAASGADATILVDPRRESSRAFLFDGDGRLLGWRNNATGETKPTSINDDVIVAPFGGVHVLSPNVMNLINQQTGPILHPWSITDFYINNADNLNIRAYTPSKPYRWHDIGTPEKLEAARADFEKSK